MKLKTIAKTISTLGKGVAMGIDPAAESGDPLELFEAWYQEAEESGLIHPEAMSLATATPDGRPSARIVLLKHADEDGFVFYTNYGSRKADEMEANPQVALVFHWPILERQLRIEGRVERASREENAAYYQSRPRGSQIGAWASRQSQVLEERDELQERVKQFTDEYDGQDVPLPEFWGGYRVRPERFEFWQGRASRLHDRLVFEREGDQWKTHRLFP